MGRRRGSLILALFVCAVMRVDAVEAAGPWQARVVSAETLEPVEGVVVLAWWTRHVRSFGGPSEEYRDSQEVLTDKDGRFTIAPRWFFSLNPLVFFRGPFFALFKPGYGQDRWRGSEDAEKWPEEKRKALGMYANLLELDGIVLELPRLQSIEERREHLKKLEIDVLSVPSGKRPLLKSAVLEERKALGYRSRVHP
jgi:hypothetical protein